VGEVDIKAGEVDIKAGEVDTKAEVEDTGEGPAEVIQSQVPG
jgi:hypothetical protein